MSTEVGYQQVFLRKWRKVENLEATTTCEFKCPKKYDLDQFMAHWERGSRIPCKLHTKFRKPRLVFQKYGICNLVLKPYRQFSWCKHFWATSIKQISRKELVDHFWKTEDKTLLSLHKFDIEWTGVYDFSGFRTSIFYSVYTLHPGLIYYR